MKNVDLECLQCWLQGSRDASVAFDVWRRPSVKAQHDEHNFQRTHTSVFPACHRQNKLLSSALDAMRCWETAPHQPSWQLCIWIHTPRPPGVPQRRQPSLPPRLRTCFLQSKALARPSTTRTPGMSLPGLLLPTSMGHWRVTIDVFWWHLATRCHGHPTDPACQSWANIRLKIPQQPEPHPHACQPPGNSCIRLLGGRQGWGCLKGVDFAKPPLPPHRPPSRRAMDRAWPPPCEPSATDPLSRARWWHGGPLLLVDLGDLPLPHGHLPNHIVRFLNDSANRPSPGAPREPRLVVGDVCLAGHLGETAFTNTGSPSQLAITLAHPPARSWKSDVGIGGMSSKRGGPPPIHVPCASGGFLGRTQCVALQRQSIDPCLNLWRPVGIRLVSWTKLRKS